MTLIKRLAAFLLVCILLCGCAETLLAGQDSIPAAAELSSRNLKVGDTLYFGTYEQDRDPSTKDKLEWQVLTIKGDKALIITTGIIKNDSYFNPSWIKYKYTYWESSYVGSASSVNYHGSGAESSATRIRGISPTHVPLADGSWGEESDLFELHARYWCNVTFYEEAFTESEKKRISTVTNANNDNPTHGTDGGPDSRDKVFFLSYDELMACMPEKSDRKCSMTAAAKHSNHGNKENDWWLRTPGKHRVNAMYVNGSNGRISTTGSDVGHDSVGYRPCLWLRLGS